MSKNHFRMIKLLFFFQILAIFGGGWVWPNLENSRFFLTPSLTQNKGSMSICLYFEILKGEKINFIKPAQNLLKMGVGGWLGETKSGKFQIFFWSLPIVIWLTTPVIASTTSQIMYIFMLSDWLKENFFVWGQNLF